jgi:hypothetical protein
LTKKASSEGWTEIGGLDTILEAAARRLSGMRLRKQRKV